MELGKLEIYKISLKLSDSVWKIYKNLPNNLKYSIGDQVLRSVDSLGANIAEGYGRYHYKDSVKFYYNARGSLWESKHWFYLLHKRELIDKNIFENMINDINTLGKKLNNFITTIRSKNEDSR